jgi:type I restriction enzyme S subunit
LDEVCGIASVLVDPRKSQYQEMIHVGGANIESATGVLGNLMTAREEALKSGKFLFDESMVLYSKIRPYLMKVARPDFCGLCSADVYPLSPDRTQLDRGYLFYLLLTTEFTEFAIAGSARAGMPKVNRDHLFGFRLSLPSLPEQRRIVGILDEAFEDLATAKANAEKNLQNARALFESHLQSVFTKTDSSHVERKLDDVCTEITVGHVGSMAKQYRNEGIPFLRSQNIRAFHVSLENVVFIDKSFHQSLAKSQLRPGDVAVVRTGYPGTAAVIPDSLPISNCSDLVIVRPGPDADPHYLALFFNSTMGKELVAGRIVGAAQKHFNVTAAKLVSISFPPIPEQHRLVTKIKVFAAETDRLASIYQQKLAALDELKKSLLHQAFSGQL